MPRVYIAGKLNGKAIDYIRNLHRMIVWAEQVRKLGLSCFVPGLDLLLGLVSDYETYDDYFNPSQSWLDVSDAVFLVPGWETSPGVKHEIERANYNGIPIFDSLDKLEQHFAKDQNEVQTV
jgi:hypothetical protein